MSLAGVPASSPDGRQQLLTLSRAVNTALAGKLTCTGEVTLTASATSTTLTDSRISPVSVLLFMPTTANAAGALSGLYVSARTNGSATLTHANTGASDKTFAYIIIG